MCEEEKRIARLLLPPGLGFWKKVRYYYRFVRFAGRSRYQSLKIAVYWSC